MNRSPTFQLVFWAFQQIPYCCLCQKEIFPLAASSRDPVNQYRSTILANEW